jgi:hypothetical protein
MQPANYQENPAQNRRVGEEREYGQGNQHQSTDRSGGSCFKLETDHTTVMQTTYRPTMQVERTESGVLLTPYLYSNIYSSGASAMQYNPTETEPLIL